MGKDLAGGTVAPLEQTQLEQSLFALRDNLGLAHVAYLSRSEIPSDTPPTYILTFPPKWIKRYQERNYLEIDPVVKVGWKEGFPLDWHEIDRSSSEIRAFFEDAKQHGIGANGLTFPLCPIGGEIAIFTVTSDIERSIWEKMQWSQIRKIKRFAEKFHQRMIILRSAQSFTLSDKETECLKLLMEGSTPKTVAGLLGISENRVRTILKQACEKLSSRTPTQAVAKAVKLRLLR